MHRLVARRWPSFRESDASPVSEGAYVAAPVSGTWRVVLEGCRKGLAVHDAPLYDTILELLKLLVRTAIVLVEPPGPQGSSLARHFLQLVWPISSKGVVPEDVHVGTFGAACRDPVVRADLPKSVQIELPYETGDVVGLEDVKPIVEIVRLELFVVNHYSCAVCGPGYSARLTFVDDLPQLLGKS